MDSQAPAQTYQQSEEQIELWIANLLRAGLMTATAVVLAGAVVYLFRHGGESPDYRVFHGETANLRGVAGILRECWRGRGAGLIQLGLLILLATPVARVAFSVVAFARQRDRFYVLVTVIVLGVLLYSIAGGRS